MSSDLSILTFNVGAAPRWRRRTTLSCQSKEPIVTFWQFWGVASTIQTFAPHLSADALLPSSLRKRRHKRELGQGMVEQREQRQASSEEAEQTGDDELDTNNESQNDANQGFANNNSAEYELPRFIANSINIYNGMARLIQDILSVIGVGEGKIHNPYERFCCIFVGSFFTLLALLASLNDPREIWRVYVDFLGSDWLPLCGGLAVVVGLPAALSYVLSRSSSHEETASQLIGRGTAVSVAFICLYLVLRTLATVFHVINLAIDWVFS